MLPQPSSAAAVGKLAACNSVTFTLAFSTACAAMLRIRPNNPSPTSRLSFTPHRSASALFRYALPALPHVFSTCVNSVLPSCILFRIFSAFRSGIAMPAYCAVFSMLVFTCCTSPTSSTGFALFTRWFSHPGFPTLLSYRMPVFCSGFVSWSTLMWM